MVETPRKTYRVAIIEDHPIVREGFIRLLEGDAAFTVCGQAAGCQSGIELIRGCRPDIILLDLFLAGGGGITFIQELKQIAPRARVLVISMHDETRYAERALQVGARGFIMKNELAPDILAAVRTVARGGIYVSPAMNLRLLEKRAAGKTATSGPKLTNRELHVLELLAEKRDTREIATKLGLSIKTIETYYERLKIKLGLSNLKDLITYAEDEFAG